MIVDASVGAKWIVKEEHSDRALEVLNEPELHAPALFEYEVCNAVLRHPTVRSTDLNLLRELELEYHAPDIQRVFEIARRYGLGFYDASYLHLSQKLGQKLVTADSKLYDKVKGHFDVVLLRDY